MACARHALTRGNTPRLGAGRGAQPPPRERAGAGVYGADAPTTPRHAVGTSTHVRIESQIGGERHGWLDRPLVHRAVCGPVMESACGSARVVCDTYERSAFAWERAEEADTRRLAIDYSRWLHLGNRYEPNRHEGAAVGGCGPAPEHAARRDTECGVSNPRDVRRMESGRFAPAVEGAERAAPLVLPARCAQRPVTRRVVLHVLAPTGRLIDVFA